MQFGPFIWKCYSESLGAKEWIDLFGSLRERFERQDGHLDRFIEQSLGQARHLSREDSPVNGADVIETIEVLESAIRDGRIPSLPKDDREASRFFAAIANLMTSESHRAEVDEEEDVFYVDDIPKLSVALFCMAPKFYFPYFFYPNFFALQSIFYGFKIELPEVPGKSNYSERFNYYFELCMSLASFADRNRIAREHIPVFLYGFAPKAIDLKTSATAFSTLASRVWVSGAGGKENSDIEFLRGVKNDAVTLWTGSREAEPGDIVLMYCIAPDKFIHSVWRCISPGFFEPFRGFHNSVWIGHPIKIPPIEFATLRADPVLSQMPLVKRTMQGLNGFEVEPIYYDRILELLESRGFKTSELPKVKTRASPVLDVFSEKEVETILLEPLLEKLGFKFEDWLRQVVVRLGRGETAIPDYILLPEFGPDQKVKSAQWVWEAKLTISVRELERDFRQARSYALLLGCAGLGLISREGIWISLGKDKFELEKIYFWSHSEVTKLKVQRELKKIAGKRFRGDLI